MAIKKRKTTVEMAIMRITKVLKSAQRGDNYISILLKDYFIWYHINCSISFYFNLILISPFILTLCWMWTVCTDFISTIVWIRHINSPADGTLSSYGHIICLLHFLQVLTEMYCCHTFSTETYRTHMIYH